MDENSTAVFLIYRQPQRFRHISRSFIIELSITRKKEDRNMNVYKPEGMLISTLENHEYISSRQGLERALERGAILEAPVILCDHSFNLHVNLGGRVRGIMPRDEVQFTRDDSEI